MIAAIKAGVRWAAAEAWEKINVVGMYRELRRLGKKHGKRFFWAALGWELIEDVVFPLIAWAMGVPELIPLFLVLHFEPIAYPAIFWGFRMYDRARGREPWEPERGSYSSHRRSLIKVFVYKVAVAGWYIAILRTLDISGVTIAAYLVLMTLFGFIHERIWHDANYGIDDDHQVEFKRVVAKAITYRIVSTMTLYPLLKATLGTVPWLALLACQGFGLIVYLLSDGMWAKSKWGVVFRAKSEPVYSPDGS